MKLIVVAGARPNFMKVAPLLWEVNRRGGIEAYLVHTGQHYDERMSKLFFEELETPRPDVDLGVGSGSHAVQTAEVMKRFEPGVLERKPDAVVVRRRQFDHRLCPDRRQAGRLVGPLRGRP